MKMLILGAILIIMSIAITSSSIDLKNLFPFRLMFLRKVWNAVIFGPHDTPFEDGTFKLTIEFTEEYPRAKCSANATK